MAPGWVPGTEHPPHLSWAAPGGGWGGWGVRQVLWPRYYLSFFKSEMGFCGGVFNLTP